MTAPTPAPTRRTPISPEAKALREALAPYINLTMLRRLAANTGDLRAALLTSNVSPEVNALLDLLTAILTPAGRDQIKGPADVAALLMVEMSRLDQEELRVVALDTKNRVLAIHTVYRGSVNSASVRVGEVFKEALRLNSVAIIIVHSHPSGDPTPSPENILVTRQIVEAGNLLDIEALDHLIISRGKWVSMRERGLGFTS